MLLQEKLDQFLLKEMAEAAHHIDVKYLHVPVAGEVPCCGAGTPIPGGRLAHAGLEKERLLILVS